MKIERILNKVTINDGESFEMENSQLSMLQVLNKNNDIRDGCVMKDDGYIYYKDGGKKKYFINKSNYGIENLWPGNHNLKKLVPLYFRIKKREKRSQEKIVKLLNEIKDKGGKAHCIPLHDYQKTLDNRNYWEYTISKWPYGEDRLSYSFDWIKRPKVVKNVNLGMLLYHYSWAFRKWNSFNILQLIEGLTYKELPDKNKYSDNDIVILNIGGLLFAYRLVDTGYKFWKLDYSNVNIEMINVEI